MAAGLAGVEGEGPFGEPSNLPPAERIEPLNVGEKSAAEY